MSGDMVAEFVWKTTEPEPDRFSGRILILAAPLSMKNKIRHNENISLNLNIRGLAQSPTLAINALCRKLTNEGKTIYNMGLGQSPFPVPVPVVETLKNHAHEKDYLPVHGLDALRNAVANFHRKQNDVNIVADNVLIGPGSKELMFLLQLVFYGDIILPTPCWVSYVPQAKIIGRNTKLIHTTFGDNWRISAELLKNYLENENDRYKPRLLLLNYPSNPDGGTFSREELIQIAAVAREYKLIILSDEIYGMLHYEGSHVSIARYYPEGTIISSGLSKWCGAGGWRLGTFSFPVDFEWLIEPIAAVASETFTSVSAPIQFAAVRAFNGGVEIDRYLSHVRRILKFIAKELVKDLTESGIRVHMPEGAFYLFIDFSDFRESLLKKGITNSPGLCMKILDETGVAILPGKAFQCLPEDLTARMSFVNFNGSRALTMSEKIPMTDPIPPEFKEVCFATLFEGIKKLTEWVSSMK